MHSYKRLCSNWKAYSVWTEDTYVSTVKCKIVANNIKNSQNINFLSTLKNEHFLQKPSIFA